MILTETKKKMNKEIMNCTINRDILIQLRKNVNNRSALVERLLTNYLRYMKGQKLDKQIIKAKLKDLEIEREQVTSKIEAYHEQLDETEREEREEEQKMLEEEKTRLEEEDKCAICENPMGVAKRSMLGKDKEAHTSCLLSTDRATIDKLMGENQNGNNKG